MSNKIRFFRSLLTSFVTCMDMAQQEQGRLSLEGCGDAVYVHNFYSDMPDRYDNSDKIFG